MGDPGAQGSGDEGHVGADGGHALGVDLGPGHQELQAAAAVGDDAPVYVAGGVVNAVGKLAGETGGVGPVGAPLSASANGKSNVPLALPVGSALGNQVGNASVARKEVARWEGSLSGGDAEVTEDTVRADGGQLHPVGGGKVGGAEGNLLHLRSGRQSRQLGQGTLPIGVEILGLGVG